MAALRPTGTPGFPAQLLLHLLCWTLVSPCGAAMALQPPSITILRTPAEPPRLGESVTVSCEATSSLPEHTLLYWLGNGSFVEKLHPDGAVREGMVLSFSAQHLHTNFTCVVLSPVGVDTREVRWPPPAPAPSGLG